MNTCGVCKYFIRQSVGGSDCQKFHPSARDFPPCRDFVLFDQISGAKKAIQELANELRENPPATMKDFEKLQTIEYLYIGLLRQGALGLAELPDVNNYKRVEMGRYDWIRNEQDMFNATEIEYPQTAKAWGMITHFGIFDSLTGGHLIISGNIEQPKLVEAGQIVRFESLKMKISLSLLNL